MTRSLKIIVFLLACVAIFVLLKKQIGDRWFSSAKPDGVAFNELIDQSDNDVKNGQISNIAAVGKGMAYDYKRLVKLVKKSGQVQASYASQFLDEMPRKQRKHLDKREIRDLLSDLYRERVRLNRFTKELKLLRHGQLPMRLSQSLAYYDEVLQKYIKTIEFILKQI